MRLFFILLIAGFGGYLGFAPRELTHTAKQAPKPVTMFCSPSFERKPMGEGQAPLINGLGNLQYKITTSSAQAQTFFNQGLTLVYAFNHGEAERSFRQVLRFDPTSAMGYWGLAMVLGPNYNAGLNPALLDEINHVLDSAAKYSVNATEKEKGLIAAMRARFPRTPVDDMAPYANAYAKAMESLHKSFPDDTDIAVLYADAMMNEHPWNLWLKDGTAQPWTPPIVAVLEQILAKSPNHPGACHFYIHTMEASRVAHRALPAANKLRTMLPAAGHLLHMPSHIDIRVGQYHEGVVANEIASAADSSYIAQCKAQGSYPLYLYPHNIHFLAACAFLEGNSNKAMQAAWKIARNADPKSLQELATIQHFYSIPYFTMVHLAKWDELLQLQSPAESLLYPRAIWTYATGMAYAAKGKMQEANEKLKQLKKALSDESLKKLLIWDMNSAHDIASIAANVLEAEILALSGQHDQAVTLLTAAVDIEDKLMYQEPPDWFFSTRHSLGHVLNQAGRFAEAEKVYRDDLIILPKNGWALRGLYNSLLGQNKKQEAAEVMKQFRQAWKWADMEIESSRKY
jgi:tetratricopeptide (TPR) repeat protein